MEWTLKFASYKTPDDILNFIISGEKTIETRSYNPEDHPNYSDIKPGDTIIFKSLDTDKIITKTAIYMHKYNSIEEMVNNEPVDKILPSLKTPEELLNFYNQVRKKWGKTYSDNLEKHGIIAIGFK